MSSEKKSPPPLRQKFENISAPLKDTLRAVFMGIGGFRKLGSPAEKMHAAIVKGISTAALGFPLVVNFGMTGYQLMLLGTAANIAVVTFGSNAGLKNMDNPSGMVKNVAAFVLATTLSAAALSAPGYIANNALANGAGFGDATQPAQMNRPQLMPS